MLFYLLFMVRNTPPPILFCLTQGAKLNLNIFPSLTSNPQEIHLLPNSVWPEAGSCFGNQLATKLVIYFFNLNLFLGPEFQGKHLEFSAEVLMEFWILIKRRPLKTFVGRVWDKTIIIKSQDSLVCKTSLKISLCRNVWTFTWVLCKE